MCVVLDNIVDYVGELPQTDTLTQFAAELGDAIKLVDEAVNVESQKMLFHTRQM